MSKELEQFGEILIRNVRDKAISQWEKVFSGTMKDETSKKIYETSVEMLSEDQKNFLQDTISQVVDTTLHYLLWTLEENERLNLNIKNDEGLDVGIKNITDGLPGELYTEDGWILKFSKKRYLEP
ncbi:epimerase [Cohnella sp. GCM10012308]|uniref:epimerase n=1 Tax=Cohnella sp. GCM10012308 TaxID=3317329 RepID=UPI00360F4707